ncbi:hypothetical protein AYL99_11888 [Fonsecaea erecta]|uniref:Uncharacterized protein n=1 Tax=Fonsecaea erecta TaxID=1367422 RepID=A0A178Z369_9EURO|nr:hypothetical protein AYL99_11888 [Fonsecaea erecta]OAP53866.1 hypothetical protein AYL99_11888 [Fonsecaea erecta]
MSSNGAINIATNTRTGSARVVFSTKDLDNGAQWHASMIDKMMMHRDWPKVYDMWKPWNSSSGGIEVTGTQQVRRVIVMMTANGFTGAFEPLASAQIVVYRAAQIVVYRAKNPDVVPTGG